MPSASGEFGNGDAVPTHEEVKTAIDQPTAKMESMMTEKLGTVMEALSRGSTENEDAAHSPARPTLRSAGDVSRESETSDPPGRYDPTMKARMPRLKQLNFDGQEKNWVMFKDDFTTQVQTCGMMHALKDSQDIDLTI
ncbi:unnamed protein product [Ectocarpus sp. CCAP 1310/34]|nr:unnamed protein product [Ectocarpus sp. CCAP 1310/34]